MLLNVTPLTDRWNRPSVNERVAIQAIFMNDGVYVDPYDISACTIFSKLTNESPNSIVDAENGLIKSDQDTATILMNFGVSGSGLNPNVDYHSGVGDFVTSKHPEWTASTLYTPGPNASGIYKVASGTFVAVLDGIEGSSLSGAYSMHQSYDAITGKWPGTVIQNGACAVQDYIDVWTVKMSESSNFQLFINTFKLENDNYITITEPLLLTTSNRLVNKHITFSSIEDIKITTEITVNNETLSKSVKDILHDYPITNAQIRIQKVNEGSVNLPAREDIFSPVYTNVHSISSDNTMLFKFNTNTIPSALQGGRVGTYVLIAQYQFVGQTIFTEPFYFTIS